MADPTDPAKHRDDVEARLRRLEGRHIDAVRYVEVAYEGATRPTWDGPAFHALDHGVEFDLDNGETWSLTWRTPGWAEELELVTGPLVPGLLAADGVVTWAVDEEWLGPRLIAAVRAVWSPTSPAPWLTTVVLTDRAGGLAVITLGDRTTQNTFAPSADNLAVFFSLDDARRAGVALPPEARAGS